MDSLASWFPPLEDLRELPVSSASFAQVKEAVIDLVGDTPAVRQALLACDEALANIVQHSGTTALAFLCEAYGNALFVLFADKGTDFDPTAHLSEEKNFEELDEGGMGLDLIRQLATSVRYERVDGMNLLALLFCLD